MLQPQIENKVVIQLDRNTRLYNSFFRGRGRIVHSVSSLSTCDKAAVFEEWHIPVSPYSSTMHAVKWTGLLVFFAKCQTVTKWSSLEFY
jgi:hypothetical protein